MEMNQETESKVTVLPRQERENGHDGREKLPAKHDWKSETLGILTSRKGMYFLGGIALIVGLRVGVNWWMHRAQVAFVPRVEVIEPSMRTIDNSLSLPGNVEAIERASLFAHVSGYLHKIYVDEGDTVKQGQLLAVIDAPDVVQEYRKAKAEYDLKQVTLKRYDSLLKEKVVSQQEYDTVSADADEAKARFENASANLGYTRITAPFAGSIARRFKYPGDLISAAAKGAENPIFILVNEDRLRVSVNVPQSEVGSIREGFPADIRVDSLPDKVFRGQISRLDALLDDATKTQRVLIDIGNTEHDLHAGMFATALLHIQHKEGALALPKGAIREDEGKQFVYVVKDGHVAKVPVTTGIHDADYVEITQGLNPKDQVIPPGGAEVKEGAEVKVMTHDAPKP